VLGLRAACFLATIDVECWWGDFVPPTLDFESNVLIVGAIFEFGFLLLEI